MPARVVGWIWQSPGRLAVEHNWWVAASAVGLMIALGLNLGQLRTSVQPLSLFGRTPTSMRDYQWLESECRQTGADGIGDCGRQVARSDR